MLNSPLVKDYYLQTLIRLKLVDLTKSVAEFERGQSGCGFYVVLATREGQHFSQSTRLEIITK